MVRNDQGTAFRYARTTRNKIRQGVSMIGQRSELLKYRADIHPYGCYMMSLIMLAWEFMDASESITSEEIIDFYDWAREHDYMGKHCYIKNPQAMVDYFCPDRLEFKGKEDGGYPVKKDQRAIQLWILNRSKGGISKHFCYGSFDPWPRSQTKRFGSIDSIRLFEVL